jgi:hypothetical protein
MIDLCKIFGVEEGEEFRIELDNVFLEVKYRIKNNIMEWSEIGTEFEGDYNKTNFSVNDVNRIKNIIKLSKKKEFTDDELAIIRSLHKELKWIARDNTENVFCYEFKPIKVGGIWHREKGKYHILKAFNHIFEEITTEDEEPVFVDDYVERGVE